MMFPLVSATLPPGRRRCRGWRLRRMVRGRSGRQRRRCPTPATRQDMPLCRSIPPAPPAGNPSKRYPGRQPPGRRQERAIPDRSVNGPVGCPLPGLPTSYLQRVVAPASFPFFRAGVIKRKQPRGPWCRFADQSSNALLRSWTLASRSPRGFRSKRCSRVARIDVVSYSV